MVSTKHLDVSGWSQVPSTLHCLVIALFVDGHGIDISFPPSVSGQE